MDDKNLTHILVIPYPAQGHMIPILDFTHHLAATGLFTVTVVVTPKNLPFLSPLLSDHSLSISPLVLPFPAVSGIPAGAENTQDLPPASFRPMMFALSKLQDPLREWFGSLSSPPSAIISDMFCGWTHRLAKELGIKRVVFSPSGAMALSVIYSLWRDMPEKEDCRNGDVVEFSGVPNSPKYPWWQLSPVYRSYQKGEGISEFIKEGFWDNIASWGLVINSFAELEGVYLRHLMGMMGHDRVWAVGPLAPPEEKVGPNCRARAGSGSYSGQVEKVMRWLDTCEDNEVVYVAFGTQALLTSEQMDAVAQGLEQSGVRFVWCAREPKTREHVETGHGRVPLGFEDCTVVRGTVLKEWAPQVAILNHRAVGAFLTHCGWNSVLEGLMAGVELIAWPMGADQFSNATLLVDYLNIGVRVCEGATSIPDPNNLARALADSVSPSQARRKEKIQKVRNEALKAVKKEGSSSKELLGLVKTLNELRIKPQVH